MKHKPGKLFEVVVMRGPATWDIPHVRATDAEGVAAAVKKAMEKDFTRIEICDVSYWNTTLATSVTLTENCPRME